VLEKNYPSGLDIGSHALADVSPRQRFIVFRELRFLASPVDETAAAPVSSLRESSSQCAKIPSSNASGFE
jgi:hypothetical protein